jgi:hypothetical protein
MVFGLPTRLSITRYVFLECCHTWKLSGVISASFRVGRLLWALKPGEPGQLFVAAALKEVPSSLPMRVAWVVGQLLIIVVS